MEAAEPQTSSQAAAGSRYALQPTRIASEDILFCIDVDAESLVEMKTTSASGRPYTRLDSIKQAIIFFITAKLTINPDHRFAYAALGKSAFWLRKEFSSDVDSAISTFRAISVDSSSYGHADLTQLFRIASHEAKKSRAQNRILRVILLYCRSSTPPTHQWPAIQKLFTLDAIYLHDKPGPENCPQKVYDALVEALELVSENEGYIFESGQGSLRVFLRHMSVLLSHPQQRCLQDYIDLPKSLAKKSPLTESTPADENAIVSIQ
ncbi:unnamed protein product [Cuscuta epithymum]|uniref:New component of the BRCA1-A complex n=1 Tax=Cuscuta epithymum TaxID=186058 RepID=A0AAV0C4I0_9ASTE|nr:unnamed protein product [Cuscuta epithymum]CAH9136458.1 unnamed protein product [Cuscuta epithymum]